ncbi:MAG: carboxypeptidase-like regulatory domain-containing protein [Bacteroidales bacterium]|nr:carboxypeptidase-like regulatory domain-containing protein [Bacteroidales bacterium]
MKKSFLLFLLLCTAQWCLMAAKIEGRVVNSKGTGLSYVSLYLKHYPEVGTITDINGRFSLEVPSMRDSLIVTLVGYETVFINLSKVNADKSLRITMKDQPVILNEVVVHVQKDSKKKKSKREERAEILAFLQKVYDQVLKDFPNNNVNHKVVSDLTATSDGKVVFFDEWIGNILEIRNYKAWDDSVQMKMDLNKRYVNQEVMGSIESFNPDDYSKRDRKHVDRVDMNSVKRVQPHKIAWELDVQKLIYRYKSDAKHWTKVDKDNHTVVLTLTLTNKLPGIYKLVRKVVCAVDKDTYSIMTISERINGEVNIPFGYKLTSAELALLNAFVLDKDGFEKYRLKGFKGTMCRNNIFRRQDGQLVTSEKNFTAEGYIIDNKDNKVVFGTKVKTKVISVQTKGVKPYSPSELTGGQIQKMSTPNH